MMMTKKSSLFEVKTVTLSVTAPGDSKFSDATVLMLNICYGSLPTLLPSQLFYMNEWSCGVYYWSSFYSQMGKSFCDRFLYMWDQLGLLILLIYGCC